MKYMLKERAQRTIDRNHELVDLWMESDTPAQFWLQQPMKVPDATANELRAFKIHWFKMCHPVLYPFLWILGLVLFICSAIILPLACLVGVGLYIPLACLVGVGLYFIVVMCHLSLHGDLMETIKWYEDGKPMDY